MGWASPAGAEATEATGQVEQVADQVLEGVVAVYDDAPVFVGDFGGDVGVAVFGDFVIFDGFEDGLNVAG